MASGGDVVLEQSRKNLAVSAFCNHFSLDPNSFLVDVAGTDIRSLCFKILQLAGKKVNTEKNDEVMKWIAYADSFPFDFDSCFEALNKLNEELCSKSVLLGGLSPCEADVVVFSVIHSFVIQLPNSDWNKYPHVLRWMEWIQNQERFGKLFKKIEIEKSEVDVGVLKCLKEIKPKAEVDSNVKANGQNTKKATDLAADTNVKTTNNKITGDNQAAAEKMKLPNKGSAEKEKEVSISLLNIRVGLIHKAWKHPSADSLLVEEIDVGDAKMRQVVSGLAKYCTPEQLTNRPVVLITNVKPGKLRDVMSEGLVLCASNLDHTVVEPLLPPEGAKLGEAISFFGNEGKPEEVLNPKKKQLEKITPHLYTDDKGVATYKGIPFMTTSGPCTSSIPNATIK